MNNKVLTLVGAVVLVLGLFLPAASVLGISINVIAPPGQGVSADGLILVACAALGAILALINQTRFAVLPGVAALAFVIYKYLYLQSTLSGATGDAEAAAVAGLVSVNLLGWIVMGLGAALILVGGLLSWKKPAA